jgi:TolA-binding protein
MCYYREKNWEETLYWLKWLMETYPETPRAAEVFYHMGLCYLKQGNIEQARTGSGRPSIGFPKAFGPILQKTG